MGKINSELLKEYIISARKNKKYNNSPDTDRVLLNILQVCNLYEEKHGKFVIDKNTYAGPCSSNFICSNCGKIIFTAPTDMPKEKFFKYCWNCGTKMDLTDDE